MRMFMTRQHLISFCLLTYTHLGLILQLPDLLSLKKKDISLT